MKYLRFTKISWLAMCAAALSIACSDDDDTTAVVADAAVDAPATSNADTNRPNSTGATDSFTSIGETSDRSSSLDVTDAGSSSAADFVDAKVPNASTDEDTSSAPDATGTSSDEAEPTGTTADADTDSTAGETSEPSGPVYPEVPALLSVSGCSDVGPLCTTSQNGAALTANCGGRLYTGTVNEARELSLTAAPEVTAQGATITRSCVGELSG